MAGASGVYVGAAVGVIVAGTGDSKTTFCPLPTVEVGVSGCAICVGSRVMMARGSMCAVGTTVGGGKGLSAVAGLV